MIFNKTFALVASLVVITACSGRFMAPEMENDTSINLTISSYCEGTMGLSTETGEFQKCFFQTKTFIERSCLNNLYPHPQCSRFGL